MTSSAQNSLDPDFLSASPLLGHLAKSSGYIHDVTTATDCDQLQAPPLDSTLSASLHEPAATLSPHAASDTSISSLHPLSDLPLSAGWSGSVQPPHEIDWPHPARSSPYLFPVTSSHSLSSLSTLVLNYAIK